jgi:hypothetical protein
MAKTKDLIALAGLAGLVYANRDTLFGGKGKDKEAKGPSATAEEEEASKVRMDAQKNAMSGNRVTNESSYTGTTKNDSNAAKNIGFGGGDDSDKNLRLSSTPVAQSVRSGKSAAEAVAPTSDPRNLEADMSRGTRPPDPRKLEAGMSRGTRPPDPRKLEAGMSRGRRMASGGMTSSASSRADGIATKGKTRGKIC